MRFPDLLSKINQLEYDMRRLENEIGIVSSRLASIQNDLNNAISWEQGSALVSRETGDRRTVEGTDGVRQTLF